MYRTAIFQNIQFSVFPWFLALTAIGRFYCIIALLHFIFNNFCCFLDYAKIVDTGVVSLNVLSQKVALSEDRSPIKKCASDSSSIEKEKARTEIRLSCDIFNLYTCVDSLRILSEVLQYVAANGDVTPASSTGEGGSPSGDSLSHTTRSSAAETTTGVTESNQRNPSTDVSYGHFTLNRMCVSSNLDGVTVLSAYN